MSTQRGNAERTRAQKYKNRHVFKNDLHDQTPQQKKLNSLHVSHVCLHCKQVIEWKIKYKKYKPLSQPKTCVKCQQRNIRKSYHVLCRDCALAERVCAKCLKPADEMEIEPPEPTPEEELKLKVEMDRLIKSLPERKRRAFLRYMKRGQADKTANQEDATAVVDDEGSDEDAIPKLRPKKIPHSRETLLKKIEELMGENNEFDSDGDEDDSCDSDEDADQSEEDAKPS